MWLMRTRNADSIAKKLAQSDFANVLVFIGIILVFIGITEISQILPLASAW
jgi:hypothetical protein